MTELNVCSEIIFFLVNCRIQFNHTVTLLQNIIIRTVLFWNWTAFNSISAVFFKFQLPTSQLDKFPNSKLQNFETSKLRNFETSKLRNFKLENLKFQTSNFKFRTSNCKNLRNIKTIKSPVLTIFFSPFSTNFKHGFSVVSIHLTL